MRLDKCPFVLLSVVKQEPTRAGHHEASTGVLEVASKNLGSYALFYNEGSVSLG